MFLFLSPLFFLIYAILSFLIGATSFVSGDGRYFSKDAAQVICCLFIFKIYKPIVFLLPFVENVSGRGAGDLNPD